MPNSYSKQSNFDVKRKRWRWHYFYLSFKHINGMHFFLNLIRMTDTFLTFLHKFWIYWKGTIFNRWRQERLWTQPREAAILSPDFCLPQGMYYRYTRWKENTQLGLWIKCEWKLHRWQWSYRQHNLLSQVGWPCDDLGGSYVRNLLDSINSYGQSTWSFVLVFILPLLVTGGISSPKICWCVRKLI